MLDRVGRSSQIDKGHDIIAAKKEGLTKDTEIVALSDGAKNGWSVLNHLKSTASLLLIS